MLASIRDLSPSHEDGLTSTGVGRDGSGTHVPSLAAIPLLFTIPVSFIVNSSLSVGTRDERGTTLDGSGLVL